VSEALGNRPSAAQLLILHAALDESDRALKSWERWRQKIGVDRADEASLRLLPLAYSRERAGDLHRLLDPAEEADALRGIYRSAWIGNKLLFERAAAATGALEQAGIPTLAIKGASLATLAYAKVALRPMDDVDLLVPHARATEAIEALGSAGWTGGKDDSLAWMQIHHSLDFTGPDGGHIDLHWFALWQPASDEPLWQASVPLDLAGAATRAPCPADQLLLVCAHGAPWSRLPSFRWIADAVTVIRAAGDALDWDRLASEAERRRLTVVISAALSYLRGEFGAPVPASVLTRLDAVRARPHELVAFRFASRPDGPARTLAMAWDRYRRLRDLDTGATPPASFPAFARSFWGLGSVWGLPLHGARSLVRRRKQAAG
jgi:hypothetical protein